MQAVPGSTKQARMTKAVAVSLYILVVEVVGGDRARDRVEVAGRCQVGLVMRC